MSEFDVQLAIERQKAAKEVADGLRAAADFIETNPELPQMEYRAEMLNFFAYSEEELATAIRIIGACEKKVDSNYFCLVKRFGPRVTIEINRKRELVCERVVVGKRVVPAKPAEPEHEEEVVEWKCPLSILSAFKQTEQQEQPAEQVA